MAIKNKLEVFKHYLVLDQNDLPPDRVTMTIDSMDAFDNQLYIGTNEGMLLLYKIGMFATVDSLDDWFFIRVICSLNNEKSRDLIVLVILIFWIFASSFIRGKCIMISTVEVVFFFVEKTSFYEHGLDSHSYTFYSFPYV